MFSRASSGRLGVVVWILCMQIGSSYNQYQSYSPAYYSRLAYAHPVPNTTPATCESTPYYYATYLRSPVPQYSSTVQTEANSLGTPSFSTGPPSTPVTSASSSQSYCRPQTVAQTSSYSYPYSRETQTVAQSPSINQNPSVYGSQTASQSTTLDSSQNSPNALTSLIWSTLSQTPVVSAYSNYYNLCSPRVFPPPPFPESKVDFDLLKKYLDERETQNAEGLCGSQPLTSKAEKRITKKTESKSAKDKQKEREKSVVFKQDSDSASLAEDSKKYDNTVYVETSTKVVSSENKKLNEQNEEEENDKSLAGIGALGDIETEQSKSKEKTENTITNSEISEQNIRSFPTVSNFNTKKLDKSKQNKENEQNAKNDNSNQDTDDNRSSLEPSEDDTAAAENIGQVASEEKWTNTENITNKNQKPQKKPEKSTHAVNSPTSDANDEKNVKSEGAPQTFENNVNFDDSSLVKPSEEDKKAAEALGIVASQESPPDTGDTGEKTNETQKTTKNSEKTPKIIKNSNKDANNEHVDDKLSTKPSEEEPKAAEGLGKLSSAESGTNIDQNKEKTKNYPQKTTDISEETSEIVENSKVEETDSKINNKSSVEPSEEDTKAAEGLGQFAFVESRNDANDHNTETKTSDPQNTPVKSGKTTEIVKNSTAEETAKKINDELSVKPSEDDNKAAEGLGKLASAESGTDTDDQNMEKKTNYSQEKSEETPEKVANSNVKEPVENIDDESTDKPSEEEMKAAEHLGKVASEDQNMEKKAVDLQETNKNTETASQIVENSNKESKRKKDEDSSVKPTEEDKKAAEDLGKVAPEASWTDTEDKNTKDETKETPEELTKTVDSSDLEKSDESSPKPSEDDTKAVEELGKVATEDSWTDNKNQGSETKHPNVEEEKSSMNSSTGSSDIADKKTEMEPSDEVIDKNGEIKEPKPEKETSTSEKMDQVLEEKSEPQGVNSNPTVEDSSTGSSDIVDKEPSDEDIDKKGEIEEPKPEKETGTSEKVDQILDEKSEPQGAKSNPTAEDSLTGSSDIVDKEPSDEVIDKKGEIEEPKPKKETGTSEKVDQVLDKKSEPQGVKSNPTAEDSSTGSSDIVDKEPSDEVIDKKGEIEEPKPKKETGTSEKVDQVLEEKPEPQGVNSNPAVEDSSKISDKGGISDVESQPTAKANEMTAPGTTGSEKMEKSGD